MNINIRNGNVIDELKKIPDESVDCVVSSPPYYGLRDYSAVATYSAGSVDEVMETANIDLQSHRGRVPDHQKDRYYLTDPLFDDKKKRWHVSLKYDVSEIWGGNPECEHGWGEVIPRQHEGGGNNGVPEEWQRPSRESHVGGNSGMFCNKCNAWKGQIGLEPTYELYTQHLILVMKELKRVLKKTGTLFWNMGDSYASSGGPSRHFGYSDPKWDKARNGSFEEPTAYDQGIEPKSLMMIPERFAMAMIDDGWILRNKLAWFKRNAMPSSVSDRFSNKWEYVFFFTKSQKYYFDLDSIRKPLAESSIKRISQENIPSQFRSGKSFDFAETEPVNNIPKIINNMHQKYQKEGAYKGSHSGYFNEDGSLRVNLSGANPGDVITSEKKPYAIAERDKDYVEYRNLPPLEEVADFLNKYRRELGYTIDQIEEKMNSQAPHHWFNAESYPSANDWMKIKDILKFPDAYDNAMTDVFLKPSEKQNNPNGANPGDILLDYSDEDPHHPKGDPTIHGMRLPPQPNQKGAFNPNGANPGDVNQDEGLYDIFTDSNIQDAFIEYLERERPELLMPSILDIPTMPHSFAHFAVFPETLVNPLIKVGCPSDVCVKCGKPKLPFFINTGRYYDHGTGEYSEYHTRETKRKIMDATGVSNSSVFNTELIKERVTKWIPSCNCNASFEPGTVLDPFAGSGTVGVVAKKQGKSAILTEISPEYAEIIKNRLEIEASGINMNVKFVETASISSLEEEE